MSRLTAIAAEIAATLDNVFQASTEITDPIQVVATRNMNPSEFPSIDIYPPDSEQTSDEVRGFGQVADEADVEFTVRARVDTRDDVSPQNILLDLADPESALCTPPAPSDDQTLNGRASSVDVERASGYRIYSDIG